MKETVLALRAVVVDEVVCTPFGVVVKAEEVWRRRAAVRAKLWNFIIVFFSLLIIVSTTTTTSCCLIVTIVCTNDEGKEIDR